MRISAVRTVAETDDFRIIEGLAYPFRGRDTYGTFFSARTNFHWDLFPDVIPTATRAESPLYVRPATYHHGFEPAFGLERIGGWSPVRMDDDGVWVQAQIDKRKDYYATRIKPLLDANALGLSGGSAEHSVRIDQKSGEIMEWPAYEVALTPVESNPLAQIAARAGDAVRIVSEAATRRDISKEERDAMPDSDFAGPNRSFPIAEPEAVKAAASSLGRASGDSDPIKAKIIAIAKRKGADFVAQLPKSWTDEGTKSGVRYDPSATDAATGAGILGSILYLIDRESDEPDQVAQLQTAADSLTEWIASERAEIGDEEDVSMVDAAMSGIRAGRRNSADDQTSIQGIHDSTVALGADCTGDASARSAEGAPAAFRLTTGPAEPPDVVLAGMQTRAVDDAVRAVVGRLTDQR